MRGGDERLKLIFQFSNFLSLILPISQPPPPGNYCTVPKKMNAVSCFMGDLKN